MEKKVAIFTWCYNNGTANYGQILQCYALQKLCENYNLDVVVIRYRKLRDEEKNFLIPAKGVERDKYEYMFRDQFIESQSSGQIQRFNEFIDNYIHVSAQCYSVDDILEEIRDKDYIILGSDQLWNPLWFDEVFLLDFVNENQCCFSYATGGITSDYGQYSKVIELIANKIEKFHAVSVREPISKSILQKYTNKKIYDVLDPTLMLSYDEWNSICGNERLYTNKYILCYFIGKVSPHKHVVKEIARSYGIKSVVYIHMSISKEQINGEGLFEKIENVGPKEFISLIKHAEVICTDSFHGFALSIEFKKVFYLMNRAYVDRNASSNMRWDNVMNKLEIKKRYANSKMDLKSVELIDYDKVEKQHMFWRKYSEKYFRRALDI